MRQLVAWAASYCRRLAAGLITVVAPAATLWQRIFAGAKVLALIAALGLAVLSLYALVLLPFTPSIADLRKAKVDQPSILISADGKHLATFKPMNREWVGLSRISPHVVNALLATEDHR